MKNSKNLRYVSKFFQIDTIIQYGEDKLTIANIVGDKQFTYIRWFADSTIKQGVRLQLIWYTEPLATNNNSIRNMKNASSSKETILDLLKTVHTPKELQNNKLIQEPIINELASQENIKPVFALRKVLQDIISKLQKEVSTIKRTEKTLQFEILRMIIFENAKESQILWDLGFDAASVSHSLDAKPRYQVKSNSEYSATSVSSFRRLKSKAVDWLHQEILQFISNS